MQTKRRSLTEACANIAVGMGVALGSQYLIFPWFGIDISHRSHIMITVWFTAISLARSYTLRRLFTRHD